MRTSRILSVIFAVICLTLPACAQKMATQPSYHPLEPSDLFPDGRSSRQPVVGTVARGQLRTDKHLHEGLDKDGKITTEFPFQVTEQVLKRGKERYNIYCSVCHGLTGLGDGRIVQRGFTRPPSYTYQINDKGLLADAKNQPLTAEGKTYHAHEVAQARKAGLTPLLSLSRSYQLREKEMTQIDMPVGDIYSLITKGYGAMPDYAEQIPVKDRWAITAYVRALQYSQMPEMREKLKGGKP